MSDGGRADGIHPKPRRLRSRGCGRGPQRSRDLLPGALPGRGRDRRGRHGERAPRARGRGWGLPEVDRHQAHPSPPHRGRPVHPHVPGRGPHRRADLPRERGAGVRPRRRRRHVLDRHGVPARRATPRGVAMLRGRLEAAYVLRPRGPHHRRRRRRAARGPRPPGQERRAPGSRAPRRHAPQPVRDLFGDHQSGRFWHREGRGEALEHAGGDPQRQAGIHVAGAGSGPRRRPGHGHLRPRRRALGGDHRAPTVPHGQ